MNRAIAKSALASAGLLVGLNSPSFSVAAPAQYTIDPQH